MSDFPITSEHIKSEGKAGRMGARITAIVAEGKNGRIYLPATHEMEEIARQAKPSWKPEVELPKNPRDFHTPQYGLTTFADLFTPRQLVTLTTFSDLVLEAREKVLKDAIAAGLPKNDEGLDAGGRGAQAYADALAVYLTFAVDKSSDYWSTVCSWHSSKELIRNTFGRQAILMIWDYCETNPFSTSSGNFEHMINWVSKSIGTLPANIFGYASQLDASVQTQSTQKVISTDPPYYDNIGYADLSDFFYTWMRRSLQPIFPLLFSSLSVPKVQELVATPYRHGGKKQAEAFFLEGMSQAMRRLSEQSHPLFPTTIYYAFKQSESTNETGVVSTGWETFLEAMIRAGFVLTGTLPLRSELSNRINGIDTNALTSSIVLVCRPRCSEAPIITRREFLAHLRHELPRAISYLKRSNIAAVDLQQAAIGPGVEVLSRYTKVVDAAGNAMTVREALSLINQILDETQSAQENDFDDATRWALSWFEDCGFAEGEFGEAEKLSTSTNISTESLVKFGLAFSKAGKVRLLKPTELSADWDPSVRSRITVWEAVHHLIRALNESEITAAKLVAKLGSKAAAARDLAYRLFVTCERKKRAQEALAYNALIQSWQEINRLSQQQQEKQESFI
ncbi:MAG: DUF1156 domain-containing protein [Verrucomicrobia bacterium]|nr:DUF1156 domain-containing protein [Verrucomicrobiota bacterium]